MYLFINSSLLCLLSLSYIKRDSISSPNFSFPYFIFIYLPSPTPRGILRERVNMLILFAAGIRIRQKLCRWIRILFKIQYNFKFKVRKISTTLLIFDVWWVEDLFVKLSTEYKKTICIPISFNNPLKACFSNKKYPITIQTRQTQIVKAYFLLINCFLTEFLIIKG